MYDKLIFELYREGRTGYQLPKAIANYELPENLKRKTEVIMPHVSENEVVRHYTNLSNKNFGVDTGFYPLGSCTMKYNPKINEDMAANPFFANVHPLACKEYTQGSLELMYNLERALSEVTGMTKVSLNPFAGSHGELAGLMIMKAYHEKNKDDLRTKVIVPDSAHGTNPASATVAGYGVVEVKSNEDGTVNVESLREAMNDEIAGIMLTNPNTLGIYEKDIVEIAKIVHDGGGLCYYDGANLNAVMGESRPGDMGFDIIHLNLHKTFSTPHGGGGPGAGPIGVLSHLEEFLPVPEVVKEDGIFRLNFDMPYTIGQMTGFYGNFGILVRAYTYILTMGGNGLAQVSKMAVLNANYIKEKLKDLYVLPIDDVCKHEFVFDGLIDKSTGVTTLDVAKRLLDLGFHAPTVYFPLIVKEAMMIEPTETESKQSLDGFIEAMRLIAQEAKDKPEYLKEAPYNTPVRRLDEATAARNPILRWVREEK